LSLTPTPPAAFWKAPMIWPAWLTASFWSFWSKSTCGRAAESELACSPAVRLHAV
jgi:hypothetical protein